jgi:hypothetical protein
MLFITAPRRGPQQRHAPRKRRPLTPLAKLLAPSWRHLAPDELDERIMLVRRMAADPTNPHRLDERDWRTLDKMRRAATYNTNLSQRQKEES